MLYEKSVIEIFDVFGQRVLSQPKTSPEASGLKPQTVLINVSNLSSGIYFLKIRTPSETAVKKIIKE